MSSLFSQLNSVPALKRHQKLFGMKVTRLDFHGRGVIPVKDRKINRVYKYSQVGLIPGDSVTLQVEDMELQFVKGRRDAIKTFTFKHHLSSELSEHYTKPFCPHFNIIHSACRGCQFQHLSPDEQRNQKLLIAQERLGKFGEVKLIGSADKLNFARLRILPHERFSFKEESDLKVFPINECPMFPNPMNEALQTCISAVKKFPVFDEIRSTGFLRDIIIRETKDHQILLGLVVAPDPTTHHLNQLSEKIRTAFQNNYVVTGVSVAVTLEDQPSRYDTEGLNFRTIYGRAQCILGDDVEVTIQTPGLATNEALDQAVTYFRSFFNPQNRVLIINPPDGSIARNFFRSSDTILSHNASSTGSTASQSSGDTTSNLKSACIELRGNLIDKSFNFRSLPGNFNSVLVLGELSEHLRTWISENPEIQTLSYATYDLNKIASDAEFIKKYFKMNNTLVVDDSPQNMRMFCISEWTRI